jgi:HB1/ASXL restriction endonuclease-like protein with HTH domain
MPPRPRLEMAMKKDEVRIGSTYTAKVSGGIAPVRITEEKWAGDKHTGWSGVNTETGRAVRIKSAQRLRAAVVPASADAAAPAHKAAKLALAPAPVARDAADVGPGGETAAEGVVLAKAGSPVPPKAASGGKGKKATAGHKTKGAKPAKVAKATKPKPERPMSGLDAAAKVLKDADKPMRVGEVLEIIQKKGLWTSKGATPEATIYAAIIREISAKGVDSRFVKKDRGLFASD